MLPPSFLSAEERNQASSQLPRHRNELFGTQYHPSKYSRDPQTITGTLELSALLAGVVSNSRHDRSSGEFLTAAAAAGSENLPWDLQLQSFSHEAPAHARPSTESPPYGVANCWTFGQNKQTNKQNQEKQNKKVNKAKQTKQSLHHQTTSYFCELTVKTDHQD